MKRSRLISVALFCVTLNLVSSLAAQAEVPTLAEIREHDFAVTTLDGRSIPLSSLLANDKPLVVEFWAT